MKKVAIIAGVLVILLMGLALYAKSDNPIDERGAPLNSMLEESVLGQHTDSAYSALRIAGFRPVEYRPGYWKRDTDNITLIIETRVEDGHEVVALVTVQV
ncbi:hypothetical protein EU642_21940 [Salmonella enterica]|nr:hypothetical protein [Salmonella enterica]EAO0118515.1 hypothetical protein [Salmonella enterica]EAO3601620.1 hypothetical protein [Salmonella enterica]EAR6391513.1 hypothetical protein [Salmonella enterica]EAV1285277.1 hypothetical protein [Salmonella enterica]